MNNILQNGAVLPSGLLGFNYGSANEAFKKTYQNFALRIGIVIQSYPIDDSKNVGKLFPEYDVMSFEQNEDQGSTSITYKNCLAASGFGSVADFFEASLRKLEKKTTKGVTPTFSGQNGAIVLVLCLNGMSETGIIIGCMAHPDRPTTLVDGTPHLEGEYNGVHIVVNADGSTALTFKGATDNSGNVIDSSQGNTVLQIKTDGSFEFNHDSIDITANRSGTLNITTKVDCNIQAQGNMVIGCVDANVTASGDLNAQVSGKGTINTGGDCDVTAGGKVVVTGSEIDLNGSSAQVLTTISSPIIDSIYGEPTIGFQKVKTGS